MFRLKYCTNEVMLLYVHLLEIVLGRLKIKKLDITIKDLKEFQKNMTTADVAKESFQFTRLWRKLPNLELSSYKILHRKGGKNNQVILSNRLKPLVFKELHVDMRYLEYGKTLQLIKKELLLAQNVR